MRIIVIKGLYTKKAFQDCCFNPFKETNFIKMIEIENEKD